MFKICAFKKHLTVGVLPLAGAIYAHRKEQFAYLFLNIHSNVLVRRKRDMAAVEET